MELLTRGYPREAKRRRGKEGPVGQQSLKSSTSMA